MFDQCKQSKFRRVRLAMKHRFAKESPAYRNSVKTTGQFVFAPGFNRMREAELM
jgi:hypothetical protein